MNGALSSALLPRQALQVEVVEVEDLAQRLLRYAHSGVSPTGAFPREMNLTQGVWIARLALAYGLDPLAEELILYQGRPYVTLAGRLRKAQEYPQFDGITCEPATEREREIFRCGEDEHLFKALVWRRDRAHPFVGCGRARRGETIRGRRGEERRAHPVAEDWPQELAQARAKQRALRDAFAIPLPGIEDAPYEERGPVIDADARELPPASPALGEPGGGIRRDQSTAIHTITHELGWDDATYRARLAEQFGVSSSLGLTEAQAATFLEALAAERDRVEGSPPASAGAPALPARLNGPASADQIRAIRQLAAQLQEPDPIEQADFTYAEAGAMIGHLQARLEERRRQPRWGI